MKKRFYIFLFLLFAQKLLFAQLSYNFKGYSIGVGGGVATAFADLAEHSSKSAYFANLNYNYTPYTTFTIEYQTGELVGGNIISNKDTRAFKNNFNAILIYADVQAGEFINYRNRTFLNIIKNFYLGAGLGFIDNRMAFVQRNSLIDPSYTFPGKDASTEQMLSLRLGYEFKFFNAYQEPGIRMRIGAESNLAYGEGLDGYDDPESKFKNHKVDRYTIISLSVRYSFGHSVSYKKPIRSYN